MALDKYLKIVSRLERESDERFHQTHRLDQRIEETLNLVFVILFLALLEKMEVDKVVHF